MKELIEQLAAKTSENNYAELWHILTALRGPDNGDEELKNLTTARLRGFLGFIHWSISSNTEPLTAGERARRDELLEKCEYHFLKHWKQAVEAVRELYGYDLEKEEYVQARQQDVTD